VIVRYYSPIPIQQTITFGALANRTYGDPAFTVSATASSGLPVTFGISGAATISGNTITLVSPGLVTVTANQPGGSGYAAAPSVSQSFMISKASQTVIFGSLSGRTMGEAPFLVFASASSGLPVVFSVVSGPAAVLGKIVTITGTGTVTLAANQSGNENYLPASQTQSFIVGADTSPPAAPVGLATSEITATSVRLTWSASSDNIGVTSYEISGVGIVTRTVTGPGVKLTGLQPQTTYTVSVKARDAAGNVSFAAAVAVTTPPVGSTGSDTDNVPDIVEDLLGTDKNATGIVDSGDQLGLRAHKPQ
jgi:hypothetical protein